MKRSLCSGGPALGLLRGRNVTHPSSIFLLTARSPCPNHPHRHHHNYHRHHHQHLHKRTGCINGHDGVLSRKEWTSLFWTMPPPQSAMEGLSGRRRGLGSSACNNNNIGMTTSKVFPDVTKEVTKKEQYGVNHLLDGLRQGDRGSLAQGITLIESEHPVKKVMSQLLLDAILTENRESTRPTLRIGLSGPPGSGKSSLIEIFGKYLTTAKNHKVAVLAVDPSSASSGGSLLGDKTRMTELSTDLNAFIRPSPTRGHLGGVTRSTNEAIMLCEFAGYDVILVETVGVGQSEYAVANMVDIFVVLIPPGGGDELQGVKRGIIEKADLILITKCDGDLQNAAHQTHYEYKSSLKYMRPSNPNWKTQILKISSRTKEGIEKLWEEILKFQKANEAYIPKKRADQRVLWTWTHVQEDLERLITENPALKRMSDKLIQDVRRDKLTPGRAADKITSFFAIQFNDNEKP